MKDIRVVSSQIRPGQDWLEQQWTDGNKVVSVALPPKFGTLPGHKMYDTDAGRKMAESMLAAREKGNE